MKYLKKEDFFPICILILIVLVLVLSVTHFTYVFGSTIDWGNQHYALPEAIRNYFYQTKDLFFEFLPTLGAGENIFYFAYHGYLNPLVLLSYLFPFIPMVTYIQITSILCVIFTVILFYAFLKKHHFSLWICFFVSFLLLCSGPLLFHAHRHTMFINYFPILLYGFFAIDTFFEKRKHLPFILTIFLLLLTSFYFSIPSIVVLTLYGIRVFLKTQEVSILSFLKEGMHFFITILLGILLASFYLFPIFFLTLQARSGTGVNIPFFSFNLSNFLYSPYNLGITAISLLAFFSLLLNKEKYLFIILFLFFSFPIFLYLLNGTLYIEAKVLIPFLPLILLFTAEFLQNIEFKKINIKTCFFLEFALLLLSFTGKKILIIPFLLDSIFCLFILFHLQKGRKKILLLYSVYFIVLLFITNFNDTLVRRQDTKFTAEKNSIQSILESDSGFFRINNSVFASQNYNQTLKYSKYGTTIYTSLENPYYNAFYFDIFQNAMSFRNKRIIGENTNLLFQTLMGNKYLLTQNETILGYKKVGEKDGISIYQNEQVYPIGYATEEVYSKENVLHLDFPYRMEALTKGIASDKGSRMPISKIKQLDWTWDFASTSNFSYQKLDTKEIVHVQEDTTVEWDLPVPLQNKVLFITFSLQEAPSCEVGDAKITINQVSNTLTCKEWKYYNGNKTFHYTISNSETIEKLVVNWQKGDYVLSNFSMYILDGQEVLDFSKNIVPLSNIALDSKKLTGDITLENDAYFQFTIPYDVGFYIYDNDKPVTIEQTGANMLGFPLEKGYHQIRLQFHAPYLKFGKICSFIGLIILFCVMILDSRRCSKEG